MERRKKQRLKIRPVKLRHGEAIVVEGVPNRSVVTLCVPSSAKVRVIRLDIRDSSSQ